MGQRNNSRNIIKGIKIYFSEIDFPLFATVVAICLFGVINMYSIAGTENYFFIRQLIFAAIGISIMTALSFFNYRYLKNYSFPVLAVYLFSIILLLLTFYSRSIRGVQSWIVLGNLTFEPSELAKLMLIILLAKYFSQRHTHINQIRHIIASGIYFGLPVIIVILQPDLGSAIVLIMLWLGVLFAAGISKRHLFLLLIIGVLVAYLSWAVVLKPYQKERILTFLNPSQDPLGAGYNLIQSKIAIGAGSWFGQGFNRGSQVNFGFLPEPYNDFVFAAVGEQFGFIGLVLIMTAILFIVYRVLNIGLRRENNFGKLFSIGLAIFIFAHAFIVAAVNVGIIPVTGIPFPFLSYGGSNLITLMTGLGIIQSIKKYG